MNDIIFRNNKDKKKERYNIILKISKWLMRLKKKSFSFLCEDLINRVLFNF